MITESTNPLTEWSLSILLIDLYVVQQKSYVQICKELHISMETLHRTLKKLNIPARKRGGHRGKILRRDEKGRIMKKIDSR